MRFERGWRAAGWILLALAMSLGAGGIVAGADHPAGDDTRPELTARGDALVAGRLAAIATQLEELEAQVGELSRSGREALSHLTERRLDELATGLDEGGRLLAGIEEGLARLRADYDRLPYGPDSDRISSRTRERITRLGEAIETLEPLPRSWRQLSLGSVPAIELAQRLEQHDQQVFGATQAGTNARYGRAVERMRRAIRTLDLAVAVRDQVATTADVGTLDEWLARARVYDEALLRLYTLLRESGGEATDESRQALAEVDRAQASLPADTDALVVIMAGIAQGGLNQAVVDIERARGKLSQALASLRDEGGNDGEGDDALGETPGP